MSGFINSAVSTVAKALERSFGSAQSPDREDIASSQTQVKHAAQTTPTKDTEVVIRSSQEEEGSHRGDRPHRLDSLKRPRSHISPDERRLMGDYRFEATQAASRSGRELTAGRTPSDAVPIKMPSANPPPNPSRKPFPGPHKPRNTLDEPLPFTSTSRKQVTYSKRTPAKTPRTSLDFQSSRGDNVQSKLYGDGFADSERPPKKQRTQRPSSATLPSESSVVDLIDDDSPEYTSQTSRVVERIIPSGLRTSAPTSTQSHVSKKSQNLNTQYLSGSGVSEPSEFRAVNNMMNAKRKSKSAASSRSNGKDQASGFVRPSPERPLLGSKPLQSTPSPQVARRRAPSDRSKADLFGPLLAVLDPDEYDVQRANLRSPHTNRASEYFRNAENSRRAEDDVELLGTRPAPQPNRTSVKHSQDLQGNSVQDRHSPPLREKFRRIGSPGKSAITGLAENRKHSDIMDSADELDGPTTIVNGAVKRQEVLNRVESTENSLQQRRRNDRRRSSGTSDDHTSVGDIPPSHFSRAQYTPIKHHDRSPAVSRKEVDSDANKLRLNLLQHRGLRFSPPNLALTYIQQRKTFEVLGQRIPAGGNEAALTIDPHVITDVYYNEDGCTKVCMARTSAGVDKYRCYIDFREPEDLGRFLSQLRTSNRRAEFVTKPDKEMELMFSRMPSKRTSAERVHAVNEDQETALLQHRTRRDTRLETPQRRLQREVTRKPPKKKLISQLQVSETDQDRSGARSVGKPSARRDDPIETDPVTQDENSRNVRSTRRTARSTNLARAKESPSPPNAVVPREQRYSVIHDLGKRWDQPVVYPPTGKKRTTVEFNDLERLDEGEFLNDNLISFYIRWAYDQANIPEDAIYFFNTYFYTSLTTTQRGQKSINYTAVQRWTAKEDIFSYDYVVVPINEDTHWYVAIICNLPSLIRDMESPVKEQYLRPASDEDDNTVEAIELQTDDPESKGIANRESLLGGANGLEEQCAKLVLNDPAPALSEKEEAAQLSRSPAEPIEIEHTQDWPDPNENEQPPTTSPFRVKQQTSRNNPVHEDSLEVAPASAKKPKKKQPPPPRKFDLNRPAIIILDSLGLSHPKTVRVLKDYLTTEARTKRNVEVDDRRMQGMTAKGIPLQSNFCDCGLFLLGYVKKFLDNPKEFISKVLSHEFDSIKDWPEMDPTKMRGKIRGILQEVAEEQAEERQKNKEKKTPSVKKSSAEVESPPEPPRAASPQVIIPVLSAKKVAPSSPDKPRDARQELRRESPQMQRKEPHSEKTSPTDVAASPEMLFDADRIEIPDSQPRIQSRNDEVEDPPWQKQLLSEAEIGSMAESSHAQAASATPRKSSIDVHDDMSHNTDSKIQILDSPTTTFPPRPSARELQRSPKKVIVRSKPE